MTNSVDPIWQGKWVWSLWRCWRCWRGPEQGMTYSSKSSLGGPESCGTGDDLFCWSNLAIWKILCFNSQLLHWGSSNGIPQRITSSAGFFAQAPKKRARSRRFEFCSQCKLELLGWAERAVGGITFWNASSYLLILRRGRQGQENIQKSAFLFIGLSSSPSNEKAADGVQSAW